MQLIMISQLVTTIHLKPWRVWHANALEAFFTVGVILVVTSSAFFVDARDHYQTVAMFSSITIIMILLSVPCVMSYGVILGWKLKGKKPYQFFLCHYKAGEGSFARLLKMYLLGRSGLQKRAKAKVFLDSDDLRDMSMLFEYVGNQSSVIVAIASELLFTKPWSMGELVTARRNKVNTCSIHMPGYKFPDEKWIENYATAVPDITCLSEYGIDVANVQEMLGWFAELSSLSIPNGFGKGTMIALCDWLVASEQVSNTLAVQDDAYPEAPSQVIICDRSAVEAMGSAQVLATLLKPTFAHEPNTVPIVLTKGKGEFPASAKVMLVVCTNNAFQQEDFLLNLHTAATREIFSIPILASESFRFPSKDFITSNAAAFRAISSTVDPSIMVLIIMETFKSIAVVFQPEQYASSEPVLEAKTVEIVERMTNSKLLIALRIPTGSTPASPSAPKQEEEACEDVEM